MNLDTIGKILLIEDDDRLSSFLSSHLEKNNYLIKTCTSGMDALETLGAIKTLEYHEIFKPDLILIDIGLPDMKGYKLLEIISKQPELSNIPYIFMSGEYIDREDILLGLNIGAYDYLCKPFDFDVLLLKIRNCIDFYSKKNENNNSNNEILDIKETAQYFRMTERTIYTLVNEGKIPALKIGGQWRFSRTILEKMFEKN